MHARLTRFKFAPDRRENLAELRQQRIQKLRNLDGLMYVFDLVSEDDEYIVLAIYRDRDCAECEATMKVAGEFWFKLGDRALGKEVDIRTYTVTYHDNMTNAA